MAPHILEMKEITKVYPNGFVANKNVCFAVDEGEIHALVGENGAGKSTLMKVLFGIEPHEEGEILLRGRPAAIKDPLHAIELGIGMVHQHFMLVPSLTVAENIILGSEPTKAGAILDLKQAVEKTQALCDRYNLPVAPTAKVRELSVGLKQKVEILKALYRNVKILILDEPTAVLTPQETKELFTELKKMRDEGHTIIFISHKLGEVKELCDRVTVLRQGRSIGTYSVAEKSEREISRLMVGRDVVAEIAKTPARPKEAVLRVKDVSMCDREGKDILEHVSFAVRRGEILGVAGVEGNGQTELSEIITGLLPLQSGEITVNGQSVAGKSIRQIRAMGVSHISEDRMTYGAAATESVWHNLISDRYASREYCGHGFLKSKRIHTLAEALIREFHIKCDNDSQPVRMLSGGNIQKVVAAREFSLSPKVSIVNQPTRGIDVGATEFVRNKLVELRDDGTAVLLISADLNEILELSDAILVMCGGRVVAYLRDSSAVSEDELGEYMLGLRTQDDGEIGRAFYER